MLGMPLSTKAEKDGVIIKGSKLLREIRDAEVETGCEISYVINRMKCQEHRRQSHGEMLGLPIGTWESLAHGPGLLCM